MASSNRVTKLMISAVQHFEFADVAYSHRERSAVMPESMTTPTVPQSMYQSGLAYCGAARMAWYSLMSIATTAMRRDIKVSSGGNTRPVRFSVWMKQSCTICKEDYSAAGQKPSLVPAGNLGTDTS